MTIDHRNRIWVGFPARNGSQLATPEHPGLLYRILRFSGDYRLELTEDLDTNNWEKNGLYLDDADEVIARTKDSVELLMPGASGIPREGKILAACGESCEIEQSFSRRTLMVTDPVSVPPVTILQGGPPHATQRCGRTVHSGQISDAYMYAMPFARDELRNPHIWRWPWCDEGRTEKLSSKVGGAVFPLNDDSILVLGSDMDRSRTFLIAVVSTNGDQKFTLHLKKDEIWETWVSASENGDRFATSIATWHGGSRVFDVSGRRVARRIEVYETSTGTTLADIPISPTKSPDLAMSPDGHRVAILADGIVTAIDVP